MFIMDEVTGDMTTRQGDTFSITVYGIDDTTPIEVNGEQEQTSVTVQSQSRKSKVIVNPTGYHNTLSNRDLPDQHQRVVAQFTPRLIYQAQ